MGNRTKKQQEQANKIGKASMTERELLHIKLEVRRQLDEKYRMNDEVSYNIGNYDWVE